MTSSTLESHHTLSVFPWTLNDYYYQSDRLELITLRVFLRDSTPFNELSKGTHPY